VETEEKFFNENPPTKSFCSVPLISGTVTFSWVEKIQKRLIDKILGSYKSTPVRRKKDDTNETLHRKTADKHTNWTHKQQSIIQSQENKDSNIQGYAKRAASLLCSTDGKVTRQFRWIVENTHVMYTHPKRNITRSGGGESHYKKKLLTPKEYWLYPCRIDTQRNGNLLSLKILKFARREHQWEKGIEFYCYALLLGMKSLPSTVL
jgi:hypothetical protein